MIKLTQAKILISTIFQKYVKSCFWYITKIDSDKSSVSSDFSILLDQKAFAGQAQDLQIGKISKSNNFLDIENKFKYYRIDQLRSDSVMNLFLWRSHLIFTRSALIKRFDLVKIKRDLHKNGYITESDRNRSILWYWACIVKYINTFANFLFNFKNMGTADTHFSSPSNAQSEW